MEWAKNAYEIGTPRRGDFLYFDENNDGVISDRDQVPLGYHIIPRISYGFSGSGAFKGFDFSFLFTGIAQSSIVHSRGFMGYDDVEGFYDDIHRHAWTEEHYLNGEKITFPALSMGANTSITNNDFSILNRSFLRLKNIELGYNLPAKWLQPMYISQIRVYASGSNLWTWTKLPIKTVDPEQTDFSVLPIMKMVNFGLNIVF